MRDSNYLGKQRENGGQTTAAPSVDHIVDQFGPFEAEILEACAVMDASQREALLSFARTLLGNATRD